MTVFKGYLKGIIRQRVVIILYLCIFLGLGVLMTLSMDDADNMYSSEQLTMCVVDRDGSELSEGLVDYLDETQELVELEDKASVFKEELYYGNIQYVLIIPQNFENDFVNGHSDEQLLKGTGRPGSVQSHYASELVNSYLSGISIYLEAGFSPEAAVAHMKNLDNSDAVTVMREGSTSMSKVAGTLQFLPFVLTALCCYAVGFVMLDYQKTEIRRRIAVSSVSSTGCTFQMLLALMVIGILFYAVSIIMTAVMNPMEIFDEPNKFYYLINIAMMVMVALSISYLVVHLAKSRNGINGLANIIALGMSFICGVFIPESMLNSSVRNIAAFLPVYWYEQNNTLLGTHNILNSSMTATLIKGYSIQFIFAVIIITAGLILGRIKGLSGVFSCR